MKITDIKCTIFDWKSPTGIGGMMQNWVGQQGAPYMVVSVLTNDGIEGHCNACVHGSKGQVDFIETRLRPILVGEDPRYIEAIWQKMFRAGRLTVEQQILPMVQGCIDLCLWDINGKAAGLPIYKMLGAYRDKVLAYACSEGCSTTDELIEEALAQKEKGYKGYKHHPIDPYNIDVKQDIQDCTALRKALGDDFILMTDPYGSYSREEAIKIGRVLDELNFEWFEEPMPEWEIESLVVLAREIKTPVLGPEIIYGSLYSTPEYIIRGAVDIVRAGVRDKGGITPLKKIAALAEAFGMDCEFHNAVAPLYSVGNLHVMCSVKNSRYHEKMVRPYWAGVIEDVEIDKQGYITVPQKPGLGLEIDWAYVKKNKIYETPPL